MNKTWKFIFNKYGLPEIHKKLSSEEIDSLPKGYPTVLKEYLEVYGLSTLNNGAFQICLPDKFTFIAEEIREFLKVYELGEIYIYAHSAFDAVYFWTQNYGRGTLELSRNELFFESLYEEEELVELTALTPFRSGIEGAEVYDDEEGEELYLRSLEKYGKLNYGECYGFFPAVAFGGEENLENIRVTNAQAHYAMLVQSQDITMLRLVIEEK